jgi:hypothetical protein
MKSLRRLLPWLVTAACFAWLYRGIAAAAVRAGSDVPSYLGGIFARVDWATWLALMIPYSLVYFAIDSLVLWRVINWFNARVRFADILPVRASTYILSLLNEQVGKGAMALYLHRREGVPGWQVGSSMLFIMFCEFYYLLGFATLGWGLQRDALPAVFGAIPWLAAGAAAFFALWLAYFRGALLRGVTLRERDILHAFRQASLSQYLWILLLRAPALLVAVVVYTLSLRLFGVDAGFGRIFGVLPVIFFGAAVPGPMRSVAITMWVTLIPEREGEMAAFGLVMHNFFIFFNAAFGLIFLRRANRELFGGASPSAAS